MTDNIVKEGELKEDLFREYVKKPVVVKAYQTDNEMLIETREGVMKADKGDYIIEGIQGEIYPCKPDIFTDTYDVVKKTKDADYWKELIREYGNQVNEYEVVRLKIESAMNSYLNTVGETEDIAITYNPRSQTVELNYYDDLFDLEQIGGFCDVFGLDIILSSRTITENYTKNITVIKNNFLFKVKRVDNDV